MKKSKMEVGLLGARLGPVWNTGILQEFHRKEILEENLPLSHLEHRNRKGNSIGITSYASQSIGKITSSLTQWKNSYVN
jgi:hypothetical protein